MGIPFSTSLHNIFERVTEPLHDLLRPSVSPHSEEHELLWDCYLSGQMSEADLDREIRDDPAFAAYVRALGQQLH